MEPLWQWSELLAWLENNQETLAKRNLEEVADMAIACGFNRSVVAQWQARETFKAKQ